MKRLKITSVLLSVSMCFSMLMTPVCVIADETADPTETAETTEITETKPAEPSEKKAAKETEAPKEAEATEETTAAKETEAVKESEPSKETEETEAPKETEATEETGATEETAQTAAPKTGGEQTDKKTKKGAVVHSGSFSNITWSLDDEGTLTVSGGNTKLKYGNGYPYLDYATEIKKVVVENPIVLIGENSFKGCSNLTDVVLNDGVTSIESRAFEECTSLKNINLPSGLTKIEVGVFRLCENLEKIVLPSGITLIDTSAFARCTSLKTINIPNGVTFIGNSAFYKCTSLESITLPDSLTVIDDYAFDSCSNLATVICSKNLTDISQSAFTGSGLTSFTIPDGIKTIYDYAFYECKKLTTIYIPKSVTKINKGAFLDCSSLTDVYQAGSENAWANVTIASKNDPLRKATVHYGESVDETYNIKVNSGTSDQTSATLNEIITITADTAPEGKRFYKWVAVKGNVSFGESKSPVTTFKMLSEDVEITATYKDIHTVTIHSGTSDKTSCILEDVIYITADSAPEGKRFDKWEVVKGNVEIVNPKESSTLFTI